jgi:hypothetical protein
MSSLAEYGARNSKHLDRYIFGGAALAGAGKLHSHMKKKATMTKMAAFADELEKIAWDGKKFREGLIDEGIPLAGATIGSRYGLRGAALGYAAGGGVSLARSYLKGEKPSHQRKLLAAGALGYGAGGLAHHALEKATAGTGKGILKRIRPVFHPPSGDIAKIRTKNMVEEALPAAGATLATGIASGTTGPKKKPNEA